MTIETVVYGVVGLLLALVVFDCGYRLGRLRGMSEAATSSTCSGQLIPDTALSFSSATAGANPSLN
jgi:hypothetical protein